jgi:hypothetical protein
MSKPIYPIQALHKHDVIQNTTIHDHTNCSSTSILPYLSQYNYEKSSKNKWLELLIILTVHQLVSCHTWVNITTKNPVKTNGWNYHTENKRAGQRKVKRRTSCKNQRRGRASPSHSRKPIAFLMLSACKSWNLIVIGGREQASLTDAIFLSIAETKACWKAILTHCLKN